MKPTYFQGDARAAHLILKDYTPADLVVTAPPYYQEGPAEEWVGLVAESLRIVADVMKPDGVLFVMLNEEGNRGLVHRAVSHAVGFGLKLFAEHVWHHGGNLGSDEWDHVFGFSLKDRPTVPGRVLSYPAPPPVMIRMNQDIRQGMRTVAWGTIPEALTLEFVNEWTDVGDVVLDPFCGGGAIPRAAARVGRVAYGIDISPETVNHARTHS